MIQDIIKRVRNAYLWNKNKSPKCSLLVANLKWMCVLFQGIFFITCGKYLNLRTCVNSWVCTGFWSERCGLKWYIKQLIFIDLWWGSRHWLPTSWFWNLKYLNPLSGTAANKFSSSPTPTLCILLYNGNTFFLFLHKFPQHFPIFFCVFSLTEWNSKKVSELWN